MAYGPNLERQQFKVLPRSAFWIASIGTSGLTASDHYEIDEMARRSGLGVIAAGNFSITAALAKHFALMTAKHLHSLGIIDYAHADKPDASSGTTAERAEELASIAQNQIEVPIAQTHGNPQARAIISGTQVHSVPLPSFVPDERLTIATRRGLRSKAIRRGTLMGVQKVMTTRGLVRGLDRLLFRDEA